MLNHADLIERDAFCHRRTDHRETHNKVAARQVRVFSSRNS